MGTRSWTRFYKAAARPRTRAQTRAAMASKTSARELVAVVYRQFDGYPEGVGKDVAAFLKEVPALASAEQLASLYVKRMIDADHRHWVADLNNGLSEFLAKLQSPRERDSAGLFIEWVYDIEVSEGEAPTLSVIPGAGVTDLCDPDQPEWVVAKGSPKEIEEWIDGLKGGAHFDCCTRTIERGNN